MYIYMYKVLCTCTCTCSCLPPFVITASLTVVHTTTLFVSVILLFTSLLHYCTCTCISTILLLLDIDILCFEIDSLLMMVVPITCNACNLYVHVDICTYIHVHCTLYMHMLHCA